MRVGPHTFTGRAVLAPMAGVTDRPFRAVCRALGASAVTGEMVSADTSLYASDKTVHRLNMDGEPGPRIVQIVGSSPEQMAEAARVNVERGADIVDINMGCPAKKVCKRAAGSALLADEALVGRILDAVVAAVDAPVTLKIRTGTSPEHRNAVSVARIAEAAGVQALAIHGRTRSERFAGAAEFDTIARVRDAIAIPLVANGDIDSPERAASVLRHTGADAIMIGRAAQGDPWIFQRIEHFLSVGELPTAPSRNERAAVVKAHVRQIYAFYGEGRGVRIARKHIGWYSGAHRNAAAFRAVVNRMESACEQLDAVTRFFSEDETAPWSDGQQRVEVA
ncbi:MAG: tRNA dihydrouridine synthase DusB [Granulosicoccaceae bacterium]